MQWVQG
jgi:hypothetical protein